MPRSQVPRLVEGKVFRRLSPSEAERGYIYLSTDKRLREVLDTECFHLDFCGKRFANRRIDKWGRLQASTTAIRAVPSHARVSISIVDRSMVRVEVVD